MSGGAGKVRTKRKIQHMKKNIILCLAFILSASVFITNPKTEASTREDTFSQKPKQEYFFTPKQPDSPLFLERRNHLIHCGNPAGTRPDIRLAGWNISDNRLLSERNLIENGAYAISRIILCYLDPPNIIFPFHSFW